MTGRGPGRPEPRRDPAAEPPGGPAQPGGDGGRPWREAAPELVIAGILVLTAAAAGYAVAGLAGVLAVAAATAAASLIVTRGLLPRAGLADEETVRRLARPTARQVSGYWQRRFAVSHGIRDLNSYQAGLRPALEHLLAARLAERHGVNLYQDPAAARKLLCRTRRDAGLWHWVDPAGTATHQGDMDGTAGPAGGIPRRTLARLLDRLERL